MLLLGLPTGRGHAHQKSPNVNNNEADHKRHVPFRLATIARESTSSETPLSCTTPLNVTPRHHVYAGGWSSAPVIGAPVRRGRERMNIAMPMRKPISLTENAKEDMIAVRRDMNAPEKNP